MLHIAKYLHAKFWLLISWLFICSAIILTLLRLFLPLVDLNPYKDDIERIAEEAAGMPISIGSMRIELHRAHLALKFIDVSLLDRETGLVRLHFREAHADIRLLASLINRQLTFRGAKVSGANLRIIRRLDGSFMVNDFQESVDARQGSIAGFFLRGTRLRLHDSVLVWQDEKSAMPALRFSQVNVSLVNSNRRHQMVASMHLGEHAGEAVQLVADLQEGSDPLDLDGQIYLKTNAFELAGRLGKRVTQGLEVASGKVDLELWGEIRRSRIEHLEGKAELTDLKLSAKQQKTLELDSFSTLFAWQAGERGWRLDLDRLVLVRNQQLWPPGRLSTATQRDADENVSLQLAADYLGLREMTQMFIMLLPQESKIHQVLTGLSPAGHLTRLRLALDHRGAEESQWQISGNVTQFQSQPWKSIPGLSGLGLKFEGDQHGGILLLGAKEFTTEMPWLFRSNLTATKLDGYFKWRYTPELGLSLKTSDLHIATEHVQTLSRLDLQIPLTGETPIIDMQTDFWDGDGAHKSRYMPVGIMPKPLVNWLDRAVVSGTVNAGSMLLHGPLQAFPYENHEGRFEVLFGVENTVLDYMPEWPRLEEVDAEVHFLNNSLNIKLSDGKILNTGLQHAEANIHQLKGASPVVIQGSVVGPVSDLFQVLNETPLKKRFGRFTREVAGSGRARTTLDLRVPLKSKDSWKINGKVDLQRAALVIKEQDLKIDNLIGRLEFDEHKVWGRDIKGIFLDRQVVLQIAPHLQNNKTMTRISTDLKTPSEWLHRRYPILDALEGDVQAALKLDISHVETDTPVRLSIHSDLKGTGVNLPPPLGKKPSEARDIDVVIDFRPKRKNDLSVDYAGLLQALLRDEGEGFQQVDLRFGAGPLELSEFPGIRLHGEMETLVLDRWVDWLNQQNKTQYVATQVPFEIDLQVAKLMFAGISCANVKIEVSSVGEDWQAMFDSEDLSGTLTLPADLDLLPIDVHLKRVNLIKADPAPAQDRHEEPQMMAGKAPSSLPALDLKVDSLLVDGEPVGHLLLKWRRVPSGIQLNHLTIVGELVNLQGRGFWRRLNGQHLTQLELKGRIESLGQFQEQFDLHLGISEAPMNIDAKLEWPLPPFALKLDKLAGTLKIKIGAGEVTEVDPGVGRLVGLFSLHAIGKRLRLDFSDMSAKGLEFDRIEGNFELSDGDAYTANLEMAGPAVKMYVSGRTGLESRDYDQEVIVTPRVSSTLPIIGALAINPTVGVVLIVGQQLFGKQVDRITQTKYQVTGSWDQPVIKKLSRDPPESEEIEDLLDMQ